MPSPYLFCVTWFRRLLIARPSRPSAWPMRKYSESLNAVPNAEVLDHIISDGEVWRADACYLRSQLEHRLQQPGWRARLAAFELRDSPRVDQCGAIENGYPTRAEGSALVLPLLRAENDLAFPGQSSHGAECSAI